MRAAVASQDQQAGSTRSLRGLAALLAAANVPIAFAFLFPSRVLVPVRPVDALAALPAFVILYGIGWALVIVLARDALLARFYKQAFLLRALVGIPLAFSFQFDDERALHDAAVAGGGRGYPQLLSAAYRIFGPNLLVAKALNVLIGSLLVALITAIPSEKPSRECSGRFALLAPPLVVFSAVNLKESITAFLLTLIVWEVLRATRAQRRLPGALAIGALSFLALWWLRGIGWLALGGAAAAAGLAAQLVWARGDLPRVYRAASAAALAVALLVVGPRVTQLVTEQLVNPRVGPQAGTSYFVDRAFAENAGVTAYLERGEPLGVRNLGVLWARGLYVPTPLRFFAAPSAALGVEMASALGWYALLLAAAAAFARQRSDPVAILLFATALVISVGTTATVALGSDPVRHRVVLVPMLCVLAASGARAEDSAFRRWALPAALAAGAAAYNLAWIATAVGR